MKERPTPTLTLSSHTPLREALHPGGPASGSLQPTQGERGGLVVSWARHHDEVRQAQRLRYDVFAGEMGARLSSSLAGHDIDLFDDYCEHLLVRDTGSGAVIGTYRVLTPEQAKRVGGIYSDAEFDLTRLRALRPRMVELGRSCVHPAHRNGGVIMALWGALAEFMARNQLDTMIGCASIGMADGGHVAATLYENLKAKYDEIASSASPADEKLRMIQQPFNELGEVLVSNLKSTAPQDPEVERSEVDMVKAFSEALQPLAQKLDLLIQQGKTVQNPVNSPPRRSFDPALVQQSQLTYSNKPMSIDEISRKIVNKQRSKTKYLACTACQRFGQLGYMGCQSTTAQARYGYLPGRKLVYLRSRQAQFQTGPVHR